MQVNDHFEYWQTHSDRPETRRLGKQLVLEEMYRAAVHEVGHVLRLSTRNPNAGSHDNGPAPFFAYNRDGTAVSARLAPLALEEPDDLQVVLYPWNTPFIRKTPTVGAQDKQRISLPLMGSIESKPNQYGSALQNLGAEVYQGKRSFWIRHEDWRKANDEAAQWEVKE